MKICIDPGHGGNDPGAISGGVQEKDINLAIALKLASKLIGAGHKAVLTRCNDEFVELYNRAEYANSINADIFVSIHNNAASNTEVQGTETLFFPGSGKGELLARLVQDELVKKLQRPDRGIKPREKLIVLKCTHMPAILIECGFLTNPVERKLLQDDGFQSLAAEAIAKGIENYIKEVKS